MSIERSPQRFDQLGVSYARTRQEDPRLAAPIYAALGSARRVVNIGAGPGSYEPRGHSVVAVEPSAVMIAQRPADAAPVVQAVAEALPFPDHSFDAALAVQTVQHWTDPERGLTELQRVAPRVVLVVGSVLTSQMWLTGDYFPGMARTRRAGIQPDRIAAFLRGAVRIEPWPLPADCTDRFGEAFWATPEAYLEPANRVGMSAFSLLEEAEIDAGLERLAADLASGAWDERYGHLRTQQELDCGHRLIIATTPA